MLKKIVSLFMAVVCFASFTVNSLALEIKEQSVQEELVLENSFTEKTEEGFKITADIVKINPNSSERLKVVVGWATFNIKINKTCTGGQANWDIVLSRNESITAVNGKMIIKQDIFGPFNPVLETMTVSERYSINTLYGSAHGVEYFTFDDDSEFDENSNIIFQWKNFTVSTVSDGYSIENGSDQGDLGDFQ